MNKKVIILSLITLFMVLFLGAVSYSSKILNPFVGLNGIVKLTLGNEKVEKISDDPLRYISRSYTDFTEYMESEGYTVEQMGRGFDLKKGDYRELVVAEGFMEIYEIFSE